MTCFDITDFSSAGVNVSNSQLNVSYCQLGSIRVHHFTFIAKLSPMQHRRRIVAHAALYYAHATYTICVSRLLPKCLVSCR